MSYPHVPSKIISSSSKQPKWHAQNYFCQLFRISQAQTLPLLVGSEFNSTELSSTDLSGLSLSPLHPLRLTCAALKAGSVWLCGEFPPASEPVYLANCRSVPISKKIKISPTSPTCSYLSLDLLFQSNAVLSRFRHLS